ncbi:MAG: hypothetical protein EXR77_18665, partial [Myxococcales bacterium]|nr:hypothetical protein [Myxococcales bacterium]
MTDSSPPQAAVLSPATSISAPIERAVTAFVPQEGRTVKPPVNPALLRHRELDEGEFWRKIPAYRDIDTATFLDYRWQGKNSITSIDKLLLAIAGLAPPEFIADASEG